MSLAPFDIPGRWHQGGREAAEESGVKIDTIVSMDLVIFSLF